MCCSLCLAAVGNYTYLQHPARCRHDPRARWPGRCFSCQALQEHLPCDIWPTSCPDVGHHLLTTPLFIGTWFLTLLSLCTPTIPLWALLGFFISYDSFRPSGRIDLIQAWVNKKKKKRKLPLSLCGNSLLFQAVILTSACAKPKCVFSYHCIFVQMKTPFKGKWNKPKQVCFNMCVSGFQIKVSISTS